MSSKSRICCHDVTVQFCNNNNKKKIKKQIKTKQNKKQKNGNNNSRRTVATKKRRVSTNSFVVRYFLLDTSSVHATMHFEIVAQVLKLLRRNGNSHKTKLLSVNCLTQCILRP